ncbi:MAG: hypothetical protein II295_07495 [Akkermansia sp.]|nr:hypothetical protein [Akkermansia sp.]
MAAYRRLSKWHSFFWLIVIAAVATCIGARLDTVDATVYNAVAKALGMVDSERTLHLLHEGQTAPPEPATTHETRRIVCPTVGVLELDDTTNKANFASLPLGPQDMAVLLHKLSIRGIRHLGITAPLIWQGNTSPIAQQMVALRLGTFENAVVGMRGRTAAEADFTPTVLRSCTIPSAHVEGDVTGLPAANRPIENDLLQANESLSLLWAPDRLEDERLTQRPSGASERSFPLLVRWNGEIMPTLPLRLAMQIKGLKPSDIHVRIGKDIRIGSTVFTLDEHGRTRLPQASTTILQIADIIDERPSSEKTDILLLSQPTDGKSESFRPHQLAATISQLCATELVEHHTVPGAPGQGLMYRNPASGWLALCILAATALFAVRVLPFCFSFVRKVFMLAVLAGILWLAYSMLVQGEWFRISTALLTWLTLAIGLRFMRPTEVRTRRVR